MKGICALRGPRSRIATFLVRVSLFSGVCLGVMVGGATAASAAEHAHADQPSASQPASESSKPDSGERTSGSGATGSSSEKPTAKASEPKTEGPRSAKPEKVEPAKPEKAQPEKPAAVEPAKPAKPAEPDVHAPAEPEVDEPAQAGTNSSSHASSEEKPGSPAKANGARHHNTPAVAHGQPEAPDPDLVSEPMTRQPVNATGTSTARDDAQPRAPDAERSSDVESPTSPSPSVPAPCSPPASSLTTASAGGFGGLRNAHAILPSAPDLSGTAATLVVQRDIGPDISTRSAETTASPD